MQIEQNTNRSKCKNTKVQTRQNTRGQNTNSKNTNVTKYKCNEIQMDQNAKRTKCKNMTNTTKYKRTIYK